MYTLTKLTFLSVYTNSDTISCLPTSTSPLVVIFRLGITGRLTNAIVIKGSIFSGTPRL